MDGLRVLGLMSKLNSRITGKGELRFNSKSIPKTCLETWGLYGTQERTHGGYLVGLKRGNSPKRHCNDGDGFTNSIKQFKHDPFFATCGMGNIVNYCGYVTAAQPLFGNVPYQSHFFVQFRFHHVPELTTLHPSFDLPASGQGKTRTPKNAFPQ